MIRRSARLIPGAILAFVLSVLTTVALAQDSVDYDAWNRTADRAQNTLAENTPSIEGLQALREELADSRQTFIEASGSNEISIDALRTQIEALGPAPAEGESESDEIAARRAELNAALAEARAPRVAADEALARANALISQIDTRVRDLETDEFLEHQQSPLNPVLWAETLSRMGRVSEDIRDEVSANVAGMRAEGTFWNNFPVVLFCLVLALVLIIRGPRWVEYLVERIETRASEQITIVAGFIISLGAILFPLVGITLISVAVISTGILGPTGQAAAIGLNVAIVVFAVVRWLGARMFPERSVTPTPITLTKENRARGRRYVWWAGALLGVAIMIRSVDEVENFDGVLISVVAFPLFVAIGYCLVRIGRLARTLSPETDEGDGKGYSDFLRGIAGRTLQVVGVLGPVLAAFGYYNMARGILLPICLTLAFVAFLASLHYVIRAAYGLFRGLNAREAEDALVPVLISLTLALISLPLVSLFWGVRSTDLIDLWTQFRAGIQIGDTTISPSDFLTVILVFAIGFMATRLVQGLLRSSVLPRTRLDKGGRNAIVSGIGYVGLTLAALAAVTAAGIDLSSFAIVVGALGVGIGFGLQNIVNNFVSGIILLIERPIGEGDWVEVNGQMGTVKSISVRSTVIETFDRTDVIVPNGDFISGTVTNWTRGNSIGRVIVPVGVAYGTDTRKVEEILGQIAKDHPIVAVTPEPAILFRAFGADSLDFEIRAILTDVTYVLAVQSDMNHEIARRFAEEGIEIPFAQRDIWLRNPETLTGHLPAARDDVRTETRAPSKPPDRGLVEGEGEAD